MKSAFLLFAFLLLCSVSFAQETVQTKPKRVAFVSKYKFEDENLGIEKLVKALRAASNPGYLPEPNLAKTKAELDKLDKDLVAPVRKEIADFLKQVEITNNFIILDSAELDRNGQILALSDALDISQKVIPLINVYFKTERIPLLTLIIPNVKIAAINSKAFTDEKTGINKIKEKVKETENLIKKQTGKNPTFDEVKEFLMKDRSEANIFYHIGNGIQSYVEKNGFNVVLDSSYKLPAELKDFQIQDVTNDFISYYNQINP